MHYCSLHLWSTVLKSLKRRLQSKTFWDELLTDEQHDMKPTIKLPSKPIRPSYTRVLWTTLNAPALTAQAEPTLLQNIPRHARLGSVYTLTHTETWTPSGSFLLAAEDLLSRSDCDWCAQELTTGCPAEDKYPSSLLWCCPPHLSSAAVSRCFVSRRASRSKHGRWTAADYSFTRIKTR